MGLRCSLLGHDFGDPEVEREREERGSEVVLTVREVATCSRCSKTKVTSENKEVTTLHDGDDHDESNESNVGASEIESVDDDSSLDTDDESLDADEPSDSSEDEADDAVIMDDEESDGRAHGEWPEADEPAAEDDAGDTPMEWPSIDTEDEGFDAQPSTGGDAAVEFEGGLAPERATVEEEEGLEYVESAGPGTAGPTSTDDAGGSSDDGGFVRAGAAPSPSEPATADVDTEFICPQCGFVDDVVGSSLRAGDVCPDCRKGYLAERDR